MLTLHSGVNEYDIATGTIALPRVGAWTSDLQVVSDELLTGAAKVTLSGVEMPCHVQRSEMIAGRLHLRLVGGAGGLGNLATAKHYRGATARPVLADLLRDAGETQAPDCSSAALNASLKAWTTLRSSEVTVGSLLQALSESASRIIGQEVIWRVQYTGKLWMGIETWPACPADVRILSGDGGNASQLLGTDALGIWPGTTVGGRRVDYVVHEVGGENRSTVHWAEAHL